MNKTTYEQLLSIINDLFEDPIFIVFAILITAIFLISWWYYYNGLNDKRAEICRVSVPPLLVSIGIFGTFLGILIALAAFNVEDRENSIIDVIDGLKLAFGTSVFGLFGSLSLKLIFMLSHRESKEDASVTSLLDKMTEVKDAISSEDDESSVLNQLTQLRTSFDNMSNKMIENASDALLPALNKFAENFNHVVNEKLSDTFNKLSESVETLVQWQENYKDHIEKFEDNAKILLDSLNTSGEKLQLIIDSTSTLPDQINRLNEIGVQLKEQMVGVNETFESFQKMKTDAADAMPIIKKNLEEITDLFKNQATKVSETLEQSTNSIESLMTKSNNMNDEFRKNLENYSGEMKTSMEIQVQTIKDAYEDIRTASKTETDKINEDLRNQFKDVADNLDTQLSGALNNIGTKLATLSDHFVKDYKPLTEKLKRVVEISKDISLASNQNKEK